MKCSVEATAQVKLRGNAPGWQLRCPKCGDVRPAAEAGIIRLGAWSRGKRVLLRCRAGCDGRRRWVHLERSTS